MTDQEGRFEGVEEVAERLLVDPQTVRRWIKSGKLKAYKPGREYRILSSDLGDFLETRSYPKVQEPLSPEQPSEATEERGEEQRDALSMITHAVTDAAQKWLEDFSVADEEWLRGIAQIVIGLADAIVSRALQSKDLLSAQEESEIIATVVRLGEVAEQALEAAADKKGSEVSEQEAQRRREQTQETIRELTRRISA